MSLKQKHMLSKRTCCTGIVEKLHFLNGMDVKELRYFVGFTAKMINTSINVREATDQSVDEI